MKKMCLLCAFLLLHVVCYRKSLHHVTPKWVVLQWYVWVANKRIREYAWAGGKEFVVRIGWRKYLYECTPFGYVNLWLRNVVQSFDIFSVFGWPQRRRVSNAILGKLKLKVAICDYSAKLSSSYLRERWNFSNSFESWARSKIQLKIRRLIWIFVCISLCM